MSADNRLSLAKSLVTTGCHQQKVCWQPAVFSNTTVYLAFSLGNLPESAVAFWIQLQKSWINFEQENNEFTIWYLITEKDLYSLHCREITDIQSVCISRFIYLINFNDRLAQLKEAKSASKNIFQKFVFSFQIICKSRIKLGFHNKSVHYSWNCTEKWIII